MSEDYESFTHERSHWHWHKDSDVVIRADSWTKMVQAPTVEIAKESITEFFQAAKRFRMQPIGQEMTVKHGDVYYTSPSAISLSGGNGFSYDSIRDLFIEDELTVGDHVFAVCANWTDWGGTFGEDSTCTTIVGLTLDSEKAKELRAFLGEYGNVEVGDGHYMPWHGYGCQLNATQILYLEVTN